KKMKKFKLLALLLLIGFFLVACSNSKVANQETPDEKGEETPNTEEPAENGEEPPAEEEEEVVEVTYTHPTDIEGEIDFWSWDPMFEDVIKEFNKMYPNVKVN